jgi:S1-C subfamily serine protease
MARSAQRLRYRFHPSGKRRAGVVEQPLRLGYGEECELALEGGEGPPVLFEVHKLPGPLQIATRVPPADMANYVELRVDGAPLDEPVRALRPGSRVDVLDKGTQRRYTLLIEPPSPWLVRPRFLAVAMVILTVLGAGYGTYLYLEIEGARSSLSRTESRVEQAEVGLREAQTRIESTQDRLAGAVRALQRERDASEQAVRTEFQARLDAMGQRARQSLEQISEEDVQAREALRREMASGLDALREDFTVRMMESYRRFKDDERAMLDSVAARMEALEPETERFKRVFAAARDAVVFVHARYTVRFLRTGEEQSYDSFGTGFLVTADGLALTAQHVLFPWRYERELVMLGLLDAVEVPDDQVRWSVWLTGEPVLDAESDEFELRRDTAFRSDGDERTVRFVYAPEPVVSAELVASPLGVVELEMPQPGGSDIAVFRLEGHAGDLAHLEISAESATLEPLDDLLVIGYPFSRLQQGVAIPQAVRGFVRRVGPDVVEVDLPLHPGLSGAPLLTGDGQVAGMAAAIFQSALYGVAARRDSLLDALDAAR